MPPGKAIERFRKVLEARIAQTERVIAEAERETRATSSRHADSADQAAAEYERQNLNFKAAAAREVLKQLNDALKRTRQGTFGECAECGSDVEPKRLEAIPWARYCLKCQELRENR